MTSLVWSAAAAATAAAVAAAVAAAAVAAATAAQNLKYLLQIDESRLAFLRPSSVQTFANLSQFFTKAQTDRKK